MIGVHLTTPPKAVVKQTLKNLEGRYTHLLKTGTVHDATNLSKDDSNDLLEETSGLDVVVSSVGAWNRTDKETLKLTSGELWNGLGVRRNRPLIVVYDEGHKASTDLQESALLDDVKPSAVLLASASPMSKTWQVRGAHHTKVSAKDVVEAGLLKERIVISDFDTSYEHAVAQTAAQREKLEQAFKVEQEPFTPKAIYVVNDSQQRPADIWRELLRAGVKVEQIRNLATTKINELKSKPTGFAAHKVEDLDAPDVRHIIFNKVLEHGWDEPQAYVAYVDEDSHSDVRVTQIIGRVLRQPDARQFTNPDLNAAYFHLLADNNDTYQKVLNAIQKEIADGWDGVVKLTTGKKKATSQPPKEQREVPRFVLDMTTTKRQAWLKTLRQFTFDPADAAVEGQIKRFEIQTATRQIQEDKAVKTDVAFRKPGDMVLQQRVEQINSRVWDYVPDEAVPPKLRGCEVSYGSKVADAIEKLARELTDGFADFVEYQPDGTWLVGSVNVHQEEAEEFKCSLHPKYSGLNSEEKEIARSLDDLGVTWVRNPSMSGYGIPLPKPDSSGSLRFFPDFIGWLKNGKVVALECKGKHLLTDAVRNKLLTLPDITILLISKEGKKYVVTRSAAGNVQTPKYDTLREAIETELGG